MPTLICTDPPWHDCLRNIYGAKNTEACDSPADERAGFGAAGGNGNFIYTAYFITSTFKVLYIGIQRIKIQAYAWEHR